MKADDFVDKLIQVQASAESAGIKLIEVRISRDQAQEIVDAFSARGLFAYRSQLSPLPDEGGVIGTMVGIRLDVPAAMLKLDVLPNESSIRAAYQLLASWAAKVKA
jgi:hypothetical protein